MTAFMLVLLLTGLAAPTGAQTPLQHTFTLRYWGSNFSFDNPGLTAFSYNQPGWGLSYRGDAVTMPYSFSANFDRLNAGGMFWETATLWNANVHYRLGTIPNGKFSVFAGYGSVNVSEQTGGQSGTGSGFRLGADFLFNLQAQQLTGFYVTGEVAWGPGWGTNFPVLPGLAGGSSIEYKLALGHDFGQGMAAQVGWRSFSWDIPTSPGCFSPGCDFRWSGWTLEFLMRR
jgi:hypothetical protein